MTERIAILVFSGGGLVLTGAVAWLALCAAMRALTRRMPDPTLPRLGRIQLYQGYDPRPDLRYRYKKACEAARVAAAQRRHLKKALKQVDPSAFVPRPKVAMFDERRRANAINAVKVRELA